MLSPTFYTILSIPDQILRIWKSLTARDTVESNRSSPNYSNFVVLSGDPGARGMYDSQRKSYYWIRMPNYVQDRVLWFYYCSRARGIQYHHRNHMRIITANGPLKFFEIQQLWPITKTKNGNYHVVVMTGRYSKLTRSIRLFNIATNTFDKVFLKLNHSLLLPEIFSDVKRTTVHRQGLHCDIQVPIFKALN